METISGNIANVVPEGGYQGQFGYVYTFQMTIQTPDGAYKTGQIGSKSQVYPLVSGAPISVEVSSYQGTTRFKKFDPQYGQPSQGQSPPQQSQQGPPVTSESTNDQRDMRIVRGNALNAVMSATRIGSDEIGEFLLTGVQFILTGVWKLSPPTHSQPPKSLNGDIDDF